MTQDMISAPASSSASSVISGLGITFCPSPDPSALNDHLANNPPSHLVAQQPSAPRAHAPLPDPRLAQPHLKRTLRGSISYDAGLSQYYHQSRPQVMVRDGSADSQTSTTYQAHQYPRPSIIPPQHMQYHHKPAPKSFYQHPGLQALHPQPPHHLSPLSEFDPSSDSESQLFSPASLSSLPSSSGLDSAAVYEHVSYAHPGLRHAQSMTSLPYSAPWPPPHVAELQMAPPPAPVKQHLPYLRPHSMQDLDQSPNEALPPPSQGSRSPSRLPQFLQDRVRRQSAMPRAQSMLELGQMYAQQEPPVETDGEGYADDERRDGGASPESIPSSAGGLQRRHLERQLQEQHEYIVAQAARERAHRRSTAVVDDEPGLGRPSTMRGTAERMRSKSMSATDRVPRDEDEEERDSWKHDRSSALRKSDMGARRRSCDAASAPAPDCSDPSETSSAPQRHNSVISTTILKESSNSRAGALQRQSTLLTAGANPFRRSMELDRLLAPNTKRAVSGVQLASIMGSPAPSSAISAASAASPARPRARSIASSSTAVVTPVALEQGTKSASKVARVELDLVLNSSLVVEGGAMKGRIDVRVRKSEVWISKPKVRVVGFEELSSGDARHIFYHHATFIESTTNTKDGALPFCDSSEDDEGFHKGRVGEHAIPFSMNLPVGKGAKGAWKCKQGVVRYIVIASVKLKSKDGADRSIAHFYRHVDIFPYYNPAVLLAPALSPLVVNASKTLFMGGNGKVNLEARLHRATWVAGQRCYVEIKVENESSKKIKSLTLSLVRTTTVFRPTGEASTATTASGDVPCTSQSTRKKVTESTLEMGKKGTKGVTAKGSWIGVEPGETADFSHSLLVPSEELSIARGRHLEVSFAIKVSVGGSLSADVSAEIPIRVVNFVSLDPPPGHLGSGSPLLHSDKQPLATSWSMNQVLSAARPPASAARVKGVQKMMSVDSLQLSDLIDGPVATRAAARPRLSRVASADSIRTNDISRAQSPAPIFEDRPPLPPKANAATSEPLPPVRRGEVIVGKAVERQLTHQMSLECISSAIASATARRQGHQRQQSGLRSVESHAEIERWEETGDDAHADLQNEDPYFAGGGEKLFDNTADPFQASYKTQDGIQLDDLDDVPDDIYAQDDPVNRLPGAFSSDDELEELKMVMQEQQQSRFSDDEDEEDESAHAHASRPRSVLKAAPQPAPQRSLVASTTRSRPSSPVKFETSTARSSLRQSDKFAFATPSSPVKAHLELAPAPASTLASPRSPVRRQPSKAALQDAAEAETMGRAPRPLPVRPTQGSTLASPTKASIARAELTKKASTTSLKRSPGVTRRPSNKSLAEAAAASSVSPRMSQNMATSSLDATSHRETTEARPPISSRPSPTISVIAPIDSPRARMTFTPSSPRKVRPSPSSPNLRSHRSMGDLRPPSSPRRGAGGGGGGASVLPSVRSKVAALETRSATLTALAGTAQRASFLARDPMAHSGGQTSARLSRADSVRSEVSDATTAGFGDLTRANSVMSFKAPMLRRK